MSRMMECANDSEAAFPETDPAAKLRARIYMGFAGMMALGLSLAGWYVGGRILAAEQPTVALASPAIISPAPVPTQQPAPASVLAVNESSKPAADSNIVVPVQVADVHPEVVEPPVSPPVPQSYLEVAGLSARQDALFVKRLHLNGFS